MLLTFNSSLETTSVKTSSIFTFVDLDRTVIHNNYKPNIMRHKRHYLTFDARATSIPVIINFARRDVKSCTSFLKVITS